MVNNMNRTILRDLERVFIEGYYNKECGEFICYPETNLYFELNDKMDRNDIACEILEWLSRDATKAKPYDSKRCNLGYNSIILGYINKYLGTHFTYNQMETIYEFLGNAINHEKTLEFVTSGYNFDCLKD